MHVCVDACMHGGGGGGGVQQPSLAILLIQHATQAQEESRLIQLPANQIAFAESI